MLGFDVDELVLEFANREMAEIGMLREIADAGRDVAAGVIDVKNSHVETADEVAGPDRGDPGDRRPARAPDAGAGLRLQPDGAPLAVAKLGALVAGRDLVRRTSAGAGQP